MGMQCENEYKEKITNHNLTNIPHPVTAGC